MAQNASPSLEERIQQSAKASHLSPKLSLVLLLALLVENGHALIRLSAPRETEPTAIEEALRKVSRQVEAILYRLLDRETLVVPEIDAELEGLLCTATTMEKQRVYLSSRRMSRARALSTASRGSSVASPGPAFAAHLPQAVILPNLDRAEENTQVKLLEAVRDGRIAYVEKPRPRKDQLRPASPPDTASSTLGRAGKRVAQTMHHERAGEDVHEDDLGGTRSLPDQFLFVAVVSSPAPHGGLFRHLADRIALSCTLTLAEVSLLDGVASSSPPEALDLSSHLKQSTPSLTHPLRIYVADLLSALRMHKHTRDQLLTSRLQHFLPTLAARRALLAGHPPGPGDVRFVWDAAVRHRLVDDERGREAIDEVLEKV